MVPYPFTPQLLDVLPEELAEVFRVRAVERACRPIVPSVILSNYKEVSQVMKINWKVRVKNINFWLALIPAVLLLVQVVAAPFGYNWDFAVLDQQLTAIVNALFGVLAILGVVNDPTTAGASDSAQARTYERPKEG